MSMAVIYRRRVLEEPTSPLAIWSRRLAVFALVVTLLSIVIERADALETVPVLVTFAAALGVALIAILVACAAFVMLWRNGGPGFAQALTAVLLGSALLAYPGYLGFKAFRLPSLTDVTTDAADPPRFEIASRLRPPNSSAYPGLATAELQRRGWPDIEPLIVSANARAAFDATMAVIAKRKWRVVDARPPQPGREGHIEAIARTPIMGFRDDVVVRIRAVREGARIDVRSASRIGYADFGTNAERVLAFLDDVDDATTEKPDRPVRPAKPAPPVIAKPQPGKR
jgi:uncharacterized protein (DUF1499 family)